MKSSLFLVLLGLFALAHGSIPIASDPVVKQWMNNMLNPAPTADTFVTIKNGTIKGSTATGVGSATIYQYFGIPYAAPPVGNLRFKAPQPYSGWGSEVRDGTNHPHSCPQYLTNVTEADEDCLFLSIYSRRGENHTGAALPVIFFIHGGGFALGQTSYYTGSKLLAEEVILVTVQYRLGPLGFLSTGDNLVSANNGMKDVVQGLRWVQENIAAFGGDPKQVTVMGESAGSVSALYMLISPLAQGLYSKVVGMSGSPLQEWAIDRNPLESTKRIATLLNCTTANNAAMVDCLAKMDWMPLVRAGLAVIMEDFTNFKMLLSGTTPVIEGNVPGAFLTDDPYKLFTEGPLPNVPILMGAVQHEGMLPLAAAHYLVLGPTGLINDTQYVRENLVGDMLVTWGVNERRDGASVSQAMSVGYFKPGSTRTNFTEIQYELMDLLSAIFMKAPILRTADILSRRLPAVYLYSFEYYNAKNSLYHMAFAIIEPILGGEKPPIRPGTMHADDLIYMFNFPFIPAIPDIAFSRTYCKLFTNFAMFGNPAPEATSAYPVWPSYNTTTQHYMKIASPPVVKQDYMQSWRQGMLP